MLNVECVMYSPGTGNRVSIKFPFYFDSLAPSLEHWTLSICTWFSAHFFFSYFFCSNEKNEHLQKMPFRFCWGQHLNGIKTLKGKIHVPFWGLIEFLFTFSPCFIILLLSRTIQVNALSDDMFINPTSLYYRQAKPSPVDSRIYMYVKSINFLSTQFKLNSSF